MSFHHSLEPRHADTGHQMINLVLWTWKLTSINTQIWRSYYSLKHIIMHCKKETFLRLRIFEALFPICSQKCVSKWVTNFSSVSLSARNRNEDYAKTTNIFVLKKIATRKIASFLRTGHEWKWWHHKHYAFDDSCSWH
jgi:hypothetical protein